MPWAAKVEPSVVRPDSGWQVAGPIHDYVYYSLFYSVMIEGHKFAGLLKM
jgi:hypothetical protein